MKLPLALPLLAIAACAAPPAPPPPDHSACAAALHDARAAFLNERILLLDELVNAYQARFDAEPALDRKREIFALQEKAVRRMVETRNELLKDPATERHNPRP